MLKRLCIYAVVVMAVSADAAIVGQNAAMTPREQLGKLLFFVKISEPNSMSCAECHSLDTGFTGPLPEINRHGATYPGAIAQRFSNRKPPSASYATFSPVFHYDEEEKLFVGGNFWDGRATGEQLGNPAADQALAPLLNPVEHNNPCKRAVVEKVAASQLAAPWEEVWGESISYATTNEAEKNFGRVGLAIAAYEASSEVNQFTSKFDIFWENARAAGLKVADIDKANWKNYVNLGLTDKETEGLALFNDEKRGKCSQCHVLEPVRDGNGIERPPVFTDFTYDNLGTPKNPENPFYGMDQVFFDDGSAINPEGAKYIDPGLGGFLETRSEWRAMAPENYGKHRVPTVRNVDRRPNKDFPKAYMHNGVFKSLKEAVHFYNTRDTEKWPPPEVPQNVNTEEIGDLGLTEAEENAIVLFMQTLSDGYRAGSLRGSVEKK
jgi:cytochrome c peroxidase